MSEEHEPPNVPGEPVAARPPSPERIAELKAKLQEDVLLAYENQKLRATISRLEAELAESRDKHMDDLLALNATAKDMREQKKTISRLLRYAYHEEECAVMTCCGDLPRCDCGYDELMKELEESK